MTIDRLPKRRPPKYVRWWSCGCPLSEEPCVRAVYPPSTSHLCDVCSIGCGHLQLVAPTLHPVTVTTILSHVKMDLYPPPVPFYRED